MNDLSREDLLEKIRLLELENAKLKESKSAVATVSDQCEYDAKYPKIDEYFSSDEYKRYGRQMIVPQFGSLMSQVKLKKSKVLFIGAGGLGCPALLYLSASGVGEIGIIDDDLVDISNLHRQVLHTTESVGIHKCESAKRYINKLNPHVKVNTYPFRLSNDNAFDIIEKYDLILDCTDTPATRYLINDVSVICGKTIVSGSGLKTDGQLSILNFRGIGPCYRCFYPKPPSPGSVTSCSDGGVVGPAIGLIGITMALEAIKVITDFYTDETFKPFLSMYSGYPQQQIRVFKMRNKQSNCAVCGNNPTVLKSTISDNDIDYAEFCGRVNPNVLAPELRISVQEYHNYINSSQGDNSILIDVRPKEQYEITKLPNSINIAWDPTFIKSDNIDSYLPSNFDKDTNTFVMCRYGNDSQMATKKLIENFGFNKVKDIKGGINKWSEEIDSKIPQY